MSPKKWVVGKLLSFRENLFSGVDVSLRESDLGKLQVTPFELPHIPPHHGPTSSFSTVGTCQGWARWAPGAVNIWGYNQTKWPYKCDWCYTFLETNSRPWKWTLGSLEIIGNHHFFKGELLVLVRECNPTYGGLSHPHLQPVFWGPLGTLGSVAGKSVLGLQNSINSPNLPRPCRSSSH